MGNIEEQQVQSVRMAFLRIFPDNFVSCSNKAPHARKSRYRIDLKGGEQQPRSGGTSTLFTQISNLLFREIILTFGNTAFTLALEL